MQGLTNLKNHGMGMSFAVLADILYEGVLMHVCVRVRMRGWRSMHSGRHACIVYASACWHADVIMSCCWQSCRFLILEALPLSFITGHALGVDFIGQEPGGLLYLSDAPHGKNDSERNRAPAASSHRQGCTHNSRPFPHSKSKPFH